MSKDSPPKEGDYHHIGGMHERWKQFNNAYGYMSIRQESFGLNFENLPDCDSASNLNERYAGFTGSDGDLTSGFPWQGGAVVSTWEYNEPNPTGDPDRDSDWSEFKQAVGAYIYSVMWRIALFTAFEKFYQVGSGGKGGHFRS